jgi:hypothetical protein
MYLPSTCIFYLHCIAPLLIKKGFSMVPRVQQQQVPWFGRSQHDKQTKQNKLASFIDRFNPWNVKCGLRNPDLIFGGVTLYHG